MPTVAGGPPEPAGADQTTSAGQGAAGAAVAAAARSFKRTGVALGRRNRPRAAGAVKRHTQVGEVGQRKSFGFGQWPAGEDSKRPATVFDS